jgi:putative membrane protein
MSHSLYLWIKAFHALGVVLWAGGLIALGTALVAIGRARAGEGAAALSAATATARLMDIGAALAIVCGMWVIVGTKAALGAQWALKQPWMHIKLTLVVVVLLSAHGLLRAKLGKFGRGIETRPPPAFLVPVVVAAVAAIAVLAIVQPLSR